MTILLQLQNAVKQVGDKFLLDGADMTIKSDQSMALVGRNGAGKSTLCRILTGTEELDGGNLKAHPDLRLGYLRQHDPFHEGETVLQFLMRDSGLSDWQCGKVAGQFELKNELLETEVRRLSGGWQTRVKLAALLLKDPNLLLLDEPTNFLDIRTQLLLERFLEDFTGTTVVVSHDRDFLMKTCRQTLELSRGKLTFYPQDIESYIQYQEDQKEIIKRSNAAIETKMKQLERFIEKNRAGANTASQARSKAKQLARLSTESIEVSEINAIIRVPEVEQRSGTALRCEQLEIGYNQKAIASDITLDLDYGERIAIVGDNGQGKTTFLRTVTNSLESVGGEFKWGYGCEIGVYAQHVYTSLPEHLTVLEYLEIEASKEMTRQQVLDTAGSFLFRGNEVQKKIQVLSGGERARLCLAGLLLGKFTVLALDEPSNHLDVETVEALANALRGYKGTILFTSHDRRFMRLVATVILEVKAGSIRAFPGQYENYLYRIKTEVEEGQRGDAGVGKGSKKRDDGMTKEQRKAEARRQHAMRKQLKSVERKVDKLTEKKLELEQKMLHVTDHVEAQSLHDQFNKVSEELEMVELEWLELSEAVGD